LFFFVVRRLITIPDMNEIALQRESHRKSSEKSIKKKPNMPHRENTILVYVPPNTRNPITEKKNKKILLCLIQYQILLLRLPFGGDFSPHWAWDAFERCATTINKKRLIKLSLLFFFLLAILTIWKLINVLSLEFDTTTPANSP
jgi:hypothetical protein